MIETAWIDPEDLDAVYDEAEITRVADLDRDGERDPDVVERAIVRAEGRVRSRLLTRFRPEQLPVAGNAPEPLRRVVIDLAWYQLHKRFDVVPAAVLRVREEAESELDDLVQGSGSVGLEGNPPVDSTRPMILHSPSREDRLTLRNLELDDRCDLIDFGFSIRPPY